ncbi:DUF4129 domain-containing protein [Paenibacillus chungangensis]|uniref:DUF4129 domain-containing protein n=1 Tax=Paenibacillus chungangensis TaxID=696535 RepID=A0ABW3HN99_9BACL
MRMKRLAGTVLRGVAELLFLFPLAVIASAYLLPDSQGMIWYAALLGSYTLPTLLLLGKESIRKGMHGLLACLMGSAYSVAVLYLLLPSPSLLQLAVCAPVSIYVAYQGIALYIRNWPSSFQSKHMLTGLAMYASALAISAFRPDDLANYHTPLIAGGITSTILFLFIANERLLSRETVDDGSRSPAYVDARRRNRMLLAALGVTLLLLSFLHRILQWIKETAERMLQQVLDWMNREKQEPPVQEEAVAQQPGGMPPLESGEPSKLMQLLEQAFKVIAIAIIAAIAIILVYFGLRGLYRLWKRLAAKLMQRERLLSSAEAAYTDEVESLTEEQPFLKRWKAIWKSKRSPVKEPSWESLGSNAERIRYLYKQLVRKAAGKGYEPGGHLTPREMAADLTRSQGDKQWSKPALDDMMTTYENARYGGHQPKDADIARHKAILEESNGRDK